MRKSSLLYVQNISECHQIPEINIMGIKTMYLCRHCLEDRNTIIKLLFGNYIASNVTVSIISDVVVIEINFPIALRNAVLYCYCT